MHKSLKVRGCLAASLVCAALSANAIELVCAGRQPQNSQQRAIYVNCSDRKSVIDGLAAAWQTLYMENIGGNTEEMCWKPYQAALESHPNTKFDDISTAFFMQCNAALRYIK